MGEFCGTPAEEERLPVVVRARLAGRGQHSTAAVSEGSSDSAVTHQETPSLPQPRDRPVLLTAIQGRLELLDSQLGFGVKLA